MIRSLLKRLVRVLLHVLWLACIVPVGMLITQELKQPETLQGTSLDFQISSDQYLTFTGEAVTLEAISSGGEFHIVGNDGSDFSSVMIDIPLAVQPKTYHVLEPTLLPAGSWHVDKGNPTVRITSDHEVTVIVRREDYLVQTVASWFIACLVWVMGLCLVQLGIDNLKHLKYLLNG